MKIRWLEMMVYLKNLLLPVEGPIHNFGGYPSMVLIVGTTSILYFDKGDIFFFYSFFKFLLLFDKLS